MRLRAAGRYQSAIAAVRRSPDIDSLLKANQVGSPPVMPAAAYYDDRLTATFQKAMLLEVKPQDALDQLTKDVQAQLDRSH